MGAKTAKVIETKNLTEDVIEITFETPEIFEFKAGQFVTIRIEDQIPPCFRAYSIKSAPNNSNTFKLCLKIVEGGRGSNWLNKLKIDDQIMFIGPSGKFLFKENGKDALFIATGTGLTPFTSMAEDQLNKGYKGKLEILFGLRHIKSIFYQDELDKLALENQNFSHTITLSRPEDDSWQGSTGRVTSVLEKMDLDPNNTEIYICGLKEMIDEVIKTLKNKGFSDESINEEKYD